MEPEPAAEVIHADRLDRELAARPGLIPVGVNASGGELNWLDLDGFHCYEGFFHQALKTYLALCNTPPQRFLTSIEVLTSLRVPGCLPPSGFIFHGGRCGSTLLARALAKSRANLVFSEAEIHNSIWSFVRNHPERGGLYRGLVLAAGRCRLPSYTAHFIKFTSFNIMHFERIRAAFPDTPAVFLFREPDTVLESLASSEQGWLGNDLGLDRTWLNGGEALEEFYRKALSVPDPLFRCLDYRDLTQDGLTSILRFFGQEPLPQDLRSMQAEFRWDAKSGVAPLAFVPRTKAPVARSGALIRQLYAQLLDRAESDWA